jgi:hypothetical protein
MLLIHFHKSPFPEGNAPIGEGVHVTIHSAPEAGKIPF